MVNYYYYMALPVYAGTRERWSYLILLQAFPAILSFVVLPCLPESPRYLLLVRRDRQRAINGTFVCHMV